MFLLTINRNNYWNHKKRCRTFNWLSVISCSALLGNLEPKTIHMFHFTGKHRSTPTCPVQLVASFNPGTGSQSYSSSDADCTRSSQYRLPFFLKDLGPRYSALSVAAHETRPGHHTQVLRDFVTKVATGFWINIISGKGGNWKLIIIEPKQNGRSIEWIKGAVQCSFFGIYRVFKDRLWWELLQKVKFKNHIFIDRNLDIIFQKQVVLPSKWSDVGYWKEWADKIAPSCLLG